MRAGEKDPASYLPPTETTRVAAREVLLLAPHPDDEVLGCCALLEQLIADGARVRVLYLSDGAGGLEGSGDLSPEEYARTRRQEAEAVAEVLGLKAHFLDLPDGALGAHSTGLTVALQEQVAACVPDLILAPSPLEVTADHQAAFKALFELLHGLRSPSPLDGTRLLLYEINHPLYPNLLVDAAPYLERLNELMALYASQEARHNYAGAGVGLRRYRALSLPTREDGLPAAAEAYVALEAKDLRFLSYSALLESLGAPVERASQTHGKANDPARAEGSVTPVVSVIVRTLNRSELLQECLSSLERSQWRDFEVVLVNDGGVAPDPGALSVFLQERVSVVNLSENRGRSGAANAGLAQARGEYVLFLDDDDRVFPEHLGTLVGAIRAAGVRVAYSDAVVGVYELSATGWECTQRRLPYSRDFDPDLLLVDNYIPFHTALIERSLIDELQAAPEVFDETLPIFEDWDFLIRLSQKAPFHHLTRVTCEYRHFLGATHHALAAGEGSTEFTKQKARILERYREQLDPQRLARVVVALRADAVENNETLERVQHERTGLERELRALQSEHRLLELRYHEKNGEVESLRPELAATRSSFDEQTEHLARTYAEIERLTGLLDEMKGSKAWRLQERLAKLKGQG